MYDLYIILAKLPGVARVDSWFDASKVEPLQSPILTNVVLCCPPTAVPTLQHNSRLQAQSAYWVAAVTTTRHPLALAVDHSIYNAANSRLNHMQVVASRAKTRAVGLISALWEWDQEENHHQAQLDICMQFGPNPPGSLGAGSR